MVDHYPLRKGLLRSHLTERTDNISRHCETDARFEAGQSEISNVQLSSASSSKLLGLMSPIVTHLGHWHVESLLLLEVLVARSSIPRSPCPRVNSGSHPRFLALCRGVVSIRGK